MSETNIFIADLLAQLPEIAPDSIISRTFYADSQLKAILFGFAPGQELSEHTAARPAILHFLQGQGELTLGEEKMAVKAGSWGHMPAHMPHSIVAIDELTMVLYLL